MTFVEAKAWLKWLFLESHKGRVGRMDYLKTRLAILLAAVVIGLLAFLMMSINSVILQAVAILAGVPLYLLILYRGITLDIQRLHDLNISGWWLLLLFALFMVPGVDAIASILAIILFFLVPGTKGPNRFGAVRPVEAPRAQAKPVAVIEAAKPVKAKLVKAKAAPKRKPAKVAVKRKKGGRA